MMLLAILGPFSYMKLSSVINVTLQVNVMLREQPEEEFGPGISFREYSLFDNPLMPQEVYFLSLHSFCMLSL